MSSLDNSPAFFTGCVDCFKIVSRIPLLSEFCVSTSKGQTPNIKDNKILNDTDSINQQTCHNHLDVCNDPKSSPHKVNDSVSLSPVLISKSPSDENNTNKCLALGNNAVRRTLLPLPSSSKMSDSNFCNKKRHSTGSETVNEKLEFNNRGEEIQIIATLNNSARHKRKIVAENNNYSDKRFKSSVIHQLQPSEDKLSKSIWQLFSECKQSDNVFKKKMRLRDQLHKILLNRFPGCGLFVVGSSMTGLGANSSDMDMCLMLTQFEIDQEREATNILQTVHNLFIQYNFLLDVEVIYAKVPILRFRDSVSGIEVDLNINNTVGIRNTQLLSSYARVDKRFPPLVVLTKLWARSHGINDAKNNTLSSYSLVLMVVHYLQYGCQPPVLPCLQKLQPDKFHPNSNVWNLNLREDLPEFVSLNKEDLGTLFVGFLKYFAQEFSFQTSVMSIRLGSVISKQTALYSSSPKNKKGHWKFICIEEPFDLTNTARAVFKPDAFYYMKQVFNKSWNTLMKTADLDSILQ